MNIKENLKGYIAEQVSKLKSKGDKVKLTNVYPDILEEVLGEFVEPYELNGHDCDYWAGTCKYEIFGTMSIGTATITLKD